MPDEIQSRLSAIDDHGRRIFASGAMADQVRAHPWQDTPLGAMAGWPEVLAWSVNLLLESRFPTVIFWGPAMIQFYNDAYQPLMAEKHPSALGQPAAVCWKEAWHIIGPQFLSVLERGETVYQENVRVPVMRNGALQDIFWTYSYSPIRVSNGEIAGILIVCHDVTGEINTMRKLRDSEGRLRRLFESDVIGVGIPTRSGGFQQSNDELLRITGYTRDDLAAGRMRWDVMTPAEYHAIDAEHIQEAALRGSCTPYEKEYIRKDGSRVPILCGYASLEDSDDEYIGFVLDLTLQKRAEEALRTSERMYRTVGEHSDYGVWTCNAEGRNTYASESFLKAIGMTQDEVSQSGWGHLLHPEDAENMDRLWKECIRVGGKWDREQRFLGIDGQWHYMLSRGAPVHDDQGKVNGWVGIHLDIGRLKQAETELREREERFRLLAESLPQLIWMSDAGGETIYTNSRFSDYTGSPEKEILVSDWRKFMHPEDLDRTNQLWQYCVEHPEPYLNEFRLRRKDGMYRHFLARAVPLVGETGRTEKWIGSCTDIHDQKLAEDALRRTEKLATAGRLAASIAHEINNPLAGVTNSLYLAMQDRTLAANTRAHLATAEEELLRVAQITKHTLRFHKQSTQANAFDLGEVMDSVLHLFRSRLAARRIAVTHEWEPGACLVGFADELRQVFANLVSNALDATAEGGRLRIRIRKCHTWDAGIRPGVRVVLGDTGQGIPEAIRQHIFEPFVTTKETTGIGLGLWVSEGIVRKHNGRIRLRTSQKADQHGTVVVLFFPQSGA